MLKITKQIEYLSPSSYFKAKDNPATFFLSRLTDETKLPREPQGLPAGDGSAFDYYIKKELIKTTFPRKKEFLPELLKSVDEPIKKTCFLKGLQLFDFYKGTGIIKKEDWSDIELWKTFNFRDLPVRVKLDASVWKEVQGILRQIPFDWKISGSRSQASPKKFYEDSYTIKTGWKGCYTGKTADWFPGVPFELIDPKWAMQMAIYGWFLGWSKDGWEDSYARLHMIANSKSGKMTLAVYEGMISAKFQENLFNDMCSIWNEIMSGEYVKHIMGNDINSCFAQSTGETWF